MAGIWTSVAPQLNSQIIDAILTMSDGYTYATTHGGRLFQFNGTNAWTQLAPQYGSDFNIFDLAEFNNQLVGADQYHLLRYNGGGAWELLADATSLGVGTLESIAVHNGKIYCGCSLYGQIIEWDGISAFNIKSQQLNLGDFARGLTHYSKTNKLYVSIMSSSAGDNTGKLYEWDDVDTLVEVAATYESDAGGTVRGVVELFDDGDSLYGLTCSGKLLKWNESDAWSLLADKSGNLYTAARRTGQLIKNNGILYFHATASSGTNIADHLLAYNSATASWDIVIEGRSASACLSITSMGNNVYGAGVLVGSYGVPMDCPIP